MARDLTTTSFAGSTPRRASHLVPTGQARKAVDCRLWHGTLQAWREPRPVRTLGENTKSVYQAYNCCWLESTTCASFAQGAVETQHVFATNYNGLPYPVRIVTDDVCEPQVYRLGLPCPETAPDVLAATTLSKASAPRQYIIQYEDSFGNRSAGSPPSAQVIVTDGAGVLLSGWALPAGDWDIQHLIILRSTPGFDSAFAEDKNEQDATWMEVAKIPATQSAYTDYINDIDLYDAMQQDAPRPPPAGLQGLTWVQSMNCLVGFVGNKLYFSSNNQYHDWQADLTLDDNIRGIVESNDIIYVATDGHPYVIGGAVDCKAAGCREVVRMPQPLPLVGSGARGIIATPNGAVYATHQGLAMMSGKGAPLILTAALYAEDDWQKLHPDTAVLAYFEGKLFAFMRKGGFCITVKDGAGTGIDSDVHTELSLRPAEAFVSRSGRLYFRTGALLSEWDRGAQLMPYRYESGTAVASVPLNFAAAQIRLDAGEVRVQMYADDVLALDETALKSTVFSLPQWVAQEFRWVLTGTATVKSLGLAPSTKVL